MTIELTEEQRITLLVALGMAVAVAMQNRQPEMVNPLREAIAVLAPDSYWARKDWNAT